MWRCAAQMALQGWACLPTAESVALTSPCRSSRLRLRCRSSLILGQTVPRAASVTPRGCRAACASWMGWSMPSQVSSAASTSSSAPAFSPLISQKLGPNKYVVPQAQILESLSSTELNEGSDRCRFFKVSSTERNRAIVS